MLLQKCAKRQDSVHVSMWYFDCVWCLLSSLGSGLGRSLGAEAVRRLCGSAWKALVIFFFFFFFERDETIRVSEIQANPQTEV